MPCRGRQERAQDLDVLDQDLDGGVVQPLVQDLGRGQAALVPELTHDGRLVGVGLVGDGEHHVHVVARLDERADARE